MSRPRAFLAAMTAVVLTAAGCGDEGAGDATSAPTATPTPSLTPSATPAPTTTAAQTPEASLDRALWPPAARATADPLEAARSFVTDYVGLAEAHLGPFQEGEPGAGEVEVFRTGEDGRRLDTVAATLSLRRLDGERWFVTSAQSEEVVVADPEPLGEVGSPLEVTGEGRGFEGNVVLQVRAAGSTEPLAEEPVVAGAMGRLAPFEATLEFEAPPGSHGAVVALTGSGVAAADGFAAFPVRFAP